MPKIEINSAETYEAAINEIQKLTGAPEDSKEENMLIDLVLAVAIWETLAPVRGYPPAGRSRLDQHPLARP